MRKCKKPVVLFVDEAHDLPRKTLMDLKRLMEMVKDGRGVLSVVLAGHPRLKNDLRRPIMEEIGNRATIFSMDKVHGENREYIYGLLEQCTKPNTAPHILCEDEAVDLLAERLKTPLQIGRHLTLAMEAAFHIGGQPVTCEVVESVLAKDINDLEPTLVRHGYGMKAPAELLNIGTGEVRKLDAAASAAPCQRAPIAVAEGCAAALTDKTNVFSDLKPVGRQCGHKPMFVGSWHLRWAGWQLIWAGATPCWQLIWARQRPYFWFETPMFVGCYT